MTAPSIRLYAALRRAGAGPARLMAAFARIDARIDALDVALDTHPLCRDGAWQALFPPAVPPDRLGAVVAGFARPQANEPPVAHQSVVSSADGPTPPRGVRLAQPTSAATGQHKARSVDTSVTGDSHSPEIPDPAPIRSLAKTKHSTATATAPRAPAATAGLTQRPRGLAGGADPLLAAAATRRVLPAPAIATQRLVQEISGGDGAGRLKGLSHADLLTSPSLLQMSRLLDQIALAPARRSPPLAGRGANGSISSTTGAASITALAPSDAARDPLHTYPPVTLPGTGLARLLARGAGDRLTTVGPAIGADVRLATAAPAPNMPQAGAARGPDLTRSDRLPQRPGAGSDATTPPAGSEALARALTDLLRREARATGIDLRGDH